MRSTQQDAEFSAYVAERRPALWRSAYLLCGDVSRADDLVQSALLKLYVAWPRLTRGAAFDGYVRRVIVNAHIDETRRPWRRETASLQGHELEVAEMPAEDHRALILALPGLPVGQRRVVVLRHYWGLSVSETAADLGISEGTVKSQCAIGLRKSRRLSPPTTEARSWHEPLRRHLDRATARGGRRPPCGTKLRRGDVRRGRAASRAPQLDGHRHRCGGRGGHGGGWCRGRQPGQAGRASTATV